MGGFNPNANMGGLTLFCPQPRRAAAEKGVKNNPADGTARQNARFRKFRRERCEMPAMIADIVNLPNVAAAADGRNQLVGV